MRASKIQFEEFIKSNLWLDIRGILLLRRSEVRDALEEGVSADISTDIEIRESARMRGRAEELKFITGLPEFIISSYDTLIEEEDENG